MKNVNIKVRVLREVKESKDYDAVEFIGGGINRAVTTSHVAGLMGSINDIGFLGHLIVVQTKAFGKLQLVLVDGQNRFSACMKLNKAINYVICELEEDNAINLTKLIARLNTHARAWQNKHFLEAFVANNLKNYIKFKELLKRSKLTFTDMLYIYLGGESQEAIRSFRSGEMSFSYEEESDNLYNAMRYCVNSLPKMSVRRQVYEFFNKCEGDYMDFAKILVETNDTFKKLTKGKRGFTDTTSGFRDELEVAFETFKSEKEKKKAA